VSGPAVRVRCPAKINLALRVLGHREEDGYHELDTVFQAIDLWDTLEARPAAGLRLTCSDPRVPTDASNLVLRAARLLSERQGRATPGAELTLRKAIPMGGGLGGGSSDAAGALLLCARLWGMSCDRGELARLGSRLGADVPFFLHGGTARGLGRGDRITPLEFAGEHPLVLGFPPFGISTREVFDRLRARLTPPENGVSLPRSFVHKCPPGNDFSLAVNDLEAVVFEVWPELERFRNALAETGAVKALMSGSGSTVYGIFADPEERGRALRTLRGEFPKWTLVGTRTIPDAVQFAD
jgi:4-diphosphocytidyl-2-C-methyl-D-erythritol kinase